MTCYNTSSGLIPRSCIFLMIPGSSFSKKSFLRFSSTISLAFRLMKYPMPLRLYMIPSPVSLSYDRIIVFGFTPISAPYSLTDGMRASGARSPLRILSQIESHICKYIDLFPLNSIISSFLEGLSALMFQCFDPEPDTCQQADVVYCVCDRVYQW